MSIQKEDDEKEILSKNDLNQNGVSEKRKGISKKKEILEKEEIKEENFSNKKVKSSPNNQEKEQQIYLENEKEKDLYYSSKNFDFFFNIFKKQKK